MERTIDQSRTNDVAPPRPALLTITGEAVAYIVIGVAAALLRFIDLGVMPLSNIEAYHALAALRFVDPTTPGPALTPVSPALFAGQVLTMALFGGDNIAARLFVAAAGFALVFTPLFWRVRLGRLPTLVFSALLAISPTAVAAARISEGAALSALLAMLAVWLAQRFGATRASPWAIALGIDLAALTLLVEPGGPLMALCLLGGLALLWALDEEDAAQRSTREALAGAVRAFPWIPALVGAAASVAVVGTLLFFNPSGLTGAGDVLGRFVQGLGTRSEGHPFAYPVLVLLAYEPLVWLFGLVGLVGAVGPAGSRRPILRFWAGWAFAALMVSLLYPGASAAHALMMVLPLAGLASRVIAARVEAQRIRAAAAEPGEREGWEGMWPTPGWGLPVYVVGITALSAAVYVNLMMVGRDVANPAMASTLQTQLPRLMLAALSAGLIAIVFFLVGATWGSRVAARGLVIATVMVLGAYTLSAAWGLAVFRTDDASELWYLDRPTRAVSQMVQVVQEGSERAVGTPNTALLVAQVPTDGALAWALRDFENVTFVESLSADIATPLVVAPADYSEPALGADYVGQRFVTRRVWRFDSLGGEGLLGWILQRYTYTPPAPVEEYIVWLRTDIYGIAEAQP